MGGVAAERNPASAGAFYPRVARLQTDHLRSVVDDSRCVKQLAEACALLPENAWRPWLAAVRQAHRRKTKLMGMLDKAGL